MRYSASWMVVGALVAALALVAHLWMLDAPDLSGGHHDTAAPVATVAQPQPLSAMPGCAGDMLACQVTMPTPLLVALALLALVSVVRVRAAAGHVDPGEEVTAHPERPPPRPRVPASVVLLI